MGRKRQPNSVDIHVAGRVQARRQVYGMSQTELAKEIGVTFQQVQKYENGENRISAGTLFNIARALKVPVASFFEGAPGDAGAQEGAEGGSAEITRFLASPDGALLAKMFMGVRKGVRKKIVKLVKSIVEGGESKK